MGKELKSVLEGLEVKEIARRMLATNGVDSLLSTIGILSGTFTATHSTDPNIYLSSVLGGAISLGLLSGFVGVYITERAERIKELRRIERAMARRLSDSLYARVINYASLYVAFWSLIGSLVLPLVSIIPVMFSKFKIINTVTGVILSVALAHVELVTIGVLLGEGNKARVSLQYLALGIAATLVSMSLGNVIG